MEDSLSASAFCQETELEGQAVVDNDTDDDWTETLITVITGEPITFASDLAEIRRPTRSRVNIVTDHATGEVTAECEVRPGDWMVMPIDDSNPHVTEVSIRKAGTAPRKFRRRSGKVVTSVCSPRPIQSPLVPNGRRLFRCSERPSAMYRPSCSTENRTITAAIPCHSTPESDDPLARAWYLRSLVDGDFQGKCLLEPTQTDEEILLIYAKETGVRSFKETSDPSQGVWHQDF